MISKISGSPSGSTAFKVPVMAPDICPVVCTGLTVGAWLKKVRLISSAMPSNRDLIGPNSVEKISPAAAALTVGRLATARARAGSIALAAEASGTAAVDAVPASVSAAAGATGCTAALRGCAEPKANDCAVSPARSRCAARDARAARAACGWVDGRLLSSIASGRLVDRTAMGSAISRGAMAAAAGTCNSRLPAAPPARLAPALADRFAVWPESAPGCAEFAEIAPDSPPSAAAVPMACGPARESPTANAAAPTRVAFPVRDISKPLRQCCCGTTVYPESVRMLSGRNRNETRRQPVLTVEPMTGIEPAYSAWEADVLPLNYIGACGRG